VFWRWDENNVEDIPVFSVASTQSRIFQLLMLAWPARCIGSWEGTQLGQLTQTGQRDILFPMMSCSVYKLGELAGGQRSLLRDGLGIVHQVLSNCICASLIY